MVEPQLAPGSKPAQHVDEIRRAAERGRDLIDRILTSGGGVPGGSSRFRSEPCSRSRLAAARRIASRRRARHRGRHRRHRRSGESAQLQQVILNLCTNAAQAMDGHGRVHVTAGQKGVVSRLLLSHGELAPGRYVWLGSTTPARASTKR